jgi:hypothetical protein
MALLDSLLPLSSIAAPEATLIVPLSMPWGRKSGLPVVPWRRMPSFTNVPPV